MTKRPQDLVQKRSSYWRRELKGYLEALFFAFIVLTFGVATVGVAGSSMEPALDGGSGRLPELLLIGDRLFVPKLRDLAAAPRRHAGLPEGRHPHRSRARRLALAEEPAQPPRQAGYRRSRRHASHPRRAGVRQRYRTRPVSPSSPRAAWH